MASELVQIAQILLSAVVGAIVGWERERRGKPAGVRTHALVCTGAALFTLVGAVLEPGGASRAAANIVVGLGFLGAGMILRDKSGVHGLTTAASIWGIAAVGTAIGAGLYVIGLFTAALLFAVSFIPHVHSSHAEQPPRRH